LPTVYSTAFAVPFPVSSGTLGALSIPLGKQGTPSSSDSASLIVCRDMRAYGRGFILIIKEKMPMNKN